MKRYLLCILALMSVLFVSANSFVSPQMGETVMQYIRNSVEPTKPAIESAGRGEVVLSCCISPNGEISKIKLKYRVLERLDNAALQLVGGMPRWIPASFENNNIEVNAEIGVSYFPTRVRLISSSETSASLEKRRLANEAVEQHKDSEIANTTDAESKSDKVENENLFDTFFKGRILKLETRLHKNEVEVGEQFKVSIIQVPGDVEMKITFPKFDHFEVLAGPIESVQETTKDGEKEVVKIFTFILRTEKVGVFQLEKATGTTKSKGDKPVDITIETKEQTIRVVQPEKLMVSTPMGGSYVVSCNTRLNIRNAPEGKVISSINNGETVLAIEQVGDWTKIDYQGTIGYVKSNYLTQAPVDSDSYGSSDSGSGFTDWLDGVMSTDFIFVLIGMFVVLLLFNLYTRSNGSYQDFFIILYVLYFVIVSILMILYTVRTNHRTMGWICFPEYAGGWGQAIINFFILVGVTINHIYALAMVYDRLRCYSRSDRVSFQVVNLFVTVLTMLPSFIPYLCIMFFRILKASRHGAGWYYGVLIFLVMLIGAYALFFLLLHMLIVTIIVAFAFLILGGFANGSKYRPSSSPPSWQESPRNIVAHDRCGNSLDLERIGENEYVDREGGRYYDNGGLIERVD